MLLRRPGPSAMMFSVLGARLAVRDVGNLGIRIWDPKMRHCVVSEHGLIRTAFLSAAREDIG